MPLFIPPAFLAATSSVFTPPAASSGTPYVMTGNSITLTPGSWMINGSGNFGNAVTTGYVNVNLGWSTANGAFTAPTVEAGFYINQYAGAGLDVIGISANTIRMTVTSSTTIFLVANIGATSTQNARITTYIYAERLNH